MLTDVLLCSDYLDNIGGYQKHHVEDACGLFSLVTLIFAGAGRHGPAEREDPERGGGEAASGVPAHAQVALHLLQRVQGRGARRGSRVNELTFYSGMEGL